MAALNDSILSATRDLVVEVVLKVIPACRVHVTEPSRSEEFRYVIRALPTEDLNDGIAIGPLQKKISCPLITGRHAVTDNYNSFGRRECVSGICP